MRNEDTSAICEECLDKAKHLRCMNTGERNFWEQDRIWYCDECYDALTSEATSDFLGGSQFEQISNNMLEECECAYSDYVCNKCMEKINDDIAQVSRPSPIPTSESISRP